MDKQNLHANMPRKHDIEDDLPADLFQVARHYAAQPVPRPTPEDTLQLMNRLLAEETVVTLASVPRYNSVFTTLRVARWRVRLLVTWFWISSVILLALLALLLVIFPDNLRPVMLILLVPLTVVLSIAHASRTFIPGLREVEASCPVGFIATTAGLTLAIVCFDSLFGLVATIGFALAQWAPFGVLLAAWLGPLLLLAGISLLVAIRWGAVPAAIIGGGPYLLLIYIAFLTDSTSLQSIVIPLGGVSLLFHYIAALVGAAILLTLLLRGSAFQSTSLLKSV